MSEYSGYSNHETLCASVYLSHSRNDMIHNFLSSSRYEDGNKLDYLMDDLYQIVEEVLEKAKVDDFSSALLNMSFDRINFKELAQDYIDRYEKK